MDKFRKKNSKFAFALTSAFICLLIIGSIYLAKDQSGLNAAEAANTSSVQPLPDDLRKSINKEFKETRHWPSKISHDSKDANVVYTFNTELSDYTRKLLAKYRSDFATIVIIDNETGDILAAEGYEGRTQKPNANLVLTSTHPSASLIKMVTAAELLENTDVSKDTKFRFKGKSTTLYKYQINSTKQNKWDKHQSFEMAFAVSNNVIFGKSAIDHTSIASLSKTAEDFGFNKPYVLEFDFLKSTFLKSIKDEFQFAEVASGFTRETIISPIHAAMISSVVANDGVIKNPRIISKITNEDDEVIWENGTQEEKILTAHSVDQMKKMMATTITSGTARKSFRKLRRGYKESLDIGGKTGSLTGGVPFGKRDWFSFYAVPKDAKYGRGISVSVMNVNVKKWHVKSTILAKEIIEHYYKEVNPIPLNNKMELADRNPAQVRATKLTNRKTITKKKITQSPSRAASKKKVVKKNNKTTSNKIVKKKSSAKKVVAKKVVKKNTKVIAKKTKKKSKEVITKSKKKNSKNEIGKNNERKSNTTI